MNSLDLIRDTGVSGPFGRVLSVREIQSQRAFEASQRRAKYFAPFVMGALLRGKAKRDLRLARESLRQAVCEYAYGTAPEIARRVAA